MQRHHTGSGRRRVIPSDWSAHHRGVLDGTRTATVTLRRPGTTGGTFNRATGKYEGATTTAAYFAGPARIQVLPTVGSDQVAAIAEQDVSTLAYAVMLDDEVGAIQIKDLITVTDMDDNGDADLIGKELVVSSIESGSLHWERKVVAILDLETQAD